MPYDAQQVAEVSEWTPKHVFTDSTDSYVVLSSSQTTSEMSVSNAEVPKCKNHFLNSLVLFLIKNILYLLIYCILYKQIPLNQI